MESVSVIGFAICLLTVAIMSIATIANPATTDYEPLMLVALFGVVFFGALAINRLVPVFMQSDRPQPRVFTV